MKIVLVLVAAGVAAYLIAPTQVAMLFGGLVQGGATGTSTAIPPQVAPNRTSVPGSQPAPSILRPNPYLMFSPGRYQRAAVGVSKR